MSNSYIFGPINSRRFGLSLGIDLSVGVKQCNFDCLYCELSPAKTTATQTITAEFKDILKDIQNGLSKYPKLDVLTFTANGEPTLYPYLSELLSETDKIKGDTKTLILSNGGNIYEPHIQDTLLGFDIVKLSLDCVSAKCFKKLDRIHESIDTDKIVGGMVEFRKRFSNSLVIETLFVKGINDTQANINDLQKAYNRIKPHRVDIGTIDRPPAFDVLQLEFKELQSIAHNFHDQHTTIAHSKATQDPQRYDTAELLTMLSMRAINDDDIKNMFDDVTKEKFDKLLKQSKIISQDVAGVVFYKAEQTKVWYHKDS